MGRKKGIDKAEKRKINTNRKSYIENKKRKYSGKRNIYCHTVDELFYKRVKKAIGMEFQWNFLNSQDKRVKILGIFAFVLYYYKSNI